MNLVEGGGSVASELMSSQNIPMRVSHRQLFSLTRRRTSLHYKETKSILVLAFGTFLVTSSHPLQASKKIKEESSLLIGTEASQEDMLNLLSLFQILKVNNIRQMAEQLGSVWSKIDVFDYETPLELLEERHSSIESSTDLSYCLHKLFARLLTWNRITFLVNHFDELESLNEKVDHWFSEITSEQGSFLSGISILKQVQNDVPGLEWVRSFDVQQLHKGNPESLDHFQALVRKCQEQLAQHKTELEPLHQQIQEVYQEFFGVFSADVAAFIDNRIQEVDPPLAEENEQLRIRSRNIYQLFYNQLVDQDMEAQLTTEYLTYLDKFKQHINSLPKDQLKQAIDVFHRMNLLDAKKSHLRNILVEYLRWLEDIIQLLRK